MTTVIFVESCLNVYFVYFTCRLRQSTADAIHSFNAVYLDNYSLIQLYCSKKETHVFVCTVLVSKEKKKKKTLQILYTAQGQA